MLTLVSIFKLVAEIALLALAGQWVLGLLAGAGRQQNLFYQLLQGVTRPVLTAVRFVTPRIVIDRHLPLVAFMLLLFVWLAATVGKISLCLEMGLQSCK